MSYSPKTLERRLSLRSALWKTKATVLSSTGMLLTVCLILLSHFYRSPPILVTDSDEEDVKDDSVLSDFERMNPNFDYE